MARQEIEIIIEKDGTVKIDAVNFEGKVCHGELDKIRKKVGKLIKTKKKPEYYKQKEYEREKTQN